MNLIEKYLAWRHAENPAPLDWEHIKRVIRAYWRKYILTPSHIRQQADWRLKVVREECRKNKACVICGCEIQGLVYDDNSCEGNCYPAMMNKEEWKYFKKKFKI